MFNRGHHYTYNIESGKCRIRKRQLQHQNVWMSHGPTRWIHQGTRYTKVNQLCPDRKSSTTLRRASGTIRPTTEEHATHEWLKELKVLPLRPDHRGRAPWEDMNPSNDKWRNLTSTKVGKTQVRAAPTHHRDTRKTQFTQRDNSRCRPSLRNIVLDDTKLRSR